MAAPQIDAARNKPQVDSTPRKRRKRAPAAGAANDCFTCSNRNVPCDRRRPYCSQCLDSGKDCSGYKTQLTWGVGVASRGKLRGLSLPIAGTQKVAGTPAHKKKRTSESISQALGKPPTRSTPEPVRGFQFDPRLPSPSYPSSPWSNMPGQDTIKIEEPAYLLSSPDRQSFAVQRPDLKFSHGRISPMSYATPSPDAPYLGQVNQISPFQPTFDPGYDHFTSYPRQDESYVRSDTYELQHTFQPPEPIDQGDVEEISREDFDPECAIIDDLSTGSTPSYLNYSLALSPFPAAAGIGKTPRMQYLINYYTEVISPVIVAFDGPNNPYRTQILRLAAESQTLQHAISALAASNLRQRQETGAISTGKTDPARRSSMAHLSLTDESWQSVGLLSPQEQAREETYHKGWAIQSLNRQLAHPILRKQDSILATLLVLCLFHICDSGVAKFQTQFAGVKKLLSLRGKELQLESPETKWFTRMFTWFDAMTASVNDREGQLQGHHLDISARSDEEWALENLAGCDGRLFKTIAQLGRLNVLSQGKRVESSPQIVSRPLPDYHNFDGNGWMRIIADEELFAAKTADADIQTQFWREWREIRQALQTWQLDTNLFDSTNSEAPLTPEQRIDLGNISESFRYSALLYTERIANPTAASTDANIQAWVRQSLNFITQVKSDVYLLWPLFITGSECVDELDRSVIRERCLDIQKDSGFLNNKSCLELLEKVWVSNSLAMQRHDHDTSGFRFSNVMKLEGNDGEYIVV